MKTYHNLFRTSVHPDRKLIATLDALEELNPSCLGDDYPGDTYNDPGEMLRHWLDESAELGLLTENESLVFYSRLWRSARNRSGAL